MPAGSFVDYLRAKQSQGRRVAPSDGVWCPSCHYRHPYNGTKDKQLDVKFEKRGDRWVTMWLCPVTGQHLRETDKYTTWKPNDAPRQS